MTGEARADTNIGDVEKPIDDGLLELRRALGTIADKVLGQTKDDDILKITREDYISAPGFGVGLDEADGHLYLARLLDGRTLVVYHSKQMTTPFDLIQGAVDRRQWKAWAYFHDGKDKITVIEPAGKTSEFQGEPGGNLTKLLEHLRSGNMLGRSLLAGAVFSRPPSK